MADGKCAPAGMTKQEAEKAGFKYYIGTPCKWGHSGRRYAHGKSGCVECIVTRALQKQVDDPQYVRDRNNRYNRRHPDKARARKDRYLAKPGKHEMKLAATAAWVERNPDYHRNYGRTYKSNRLKTDLEFKLREYLRSRLRIAVKQNNRAGSAVSELGCSIAEFKTHIEKLFKPGMTWSNWGVGAGKWQLDHIRELAEFDLGDAAQFAIAAHYTNYQPLWSEENNAKRSFPAGRGKFGKSRQPEVGAAP